MISKPDIEKLKDIISEKVYDQVANGEQSITLNQIDNDIKACGQFLMKERTQRGIHGTAAALRVISENQSDKYKVLIPQIIKYLDERNQIEVHAIFENLKPDATKDDNNVIKLSEQLYALSFVKVGQGSVNSLANEIKQSITNSKIDNKGWSYFTDDKSAVEILPTSFVVMALYANNYSDEESLQYIIKQLENILKTPINDPSTFAILVFAFYVITFKVEDRIVKDKIKGVQLNQIFNKLWNSPFCVLDENIEQNIEYWINDKHYYIRVPWQLYIISLSTKYSVWVFSKIKTQNRLKSIVESFANNGGFKYKYSGKYLSTRTTSILFDTLSVIENNLGNKTWYTILNAIDRVKIFIGSKWIKYPIVIILVVTFIYTIWLWINSEGTISEKVIHLGPHFLVYLLVLLYEFGKRRK